jgi:hypothetical protein
MGRLVFIPFSIVAGLVAGLLGRKVFDLVWGAFDDQEPPSPEHHDATWGRLTIAGALQGAVFGAARAVADHAARRGYARFTGEWPGEDEADPA